MSTRSGSENRGELTPAMASGTLEQVREILFGAVHRDLERRLARADALLATRSGEIEQEIRRRTDILQAHLRDEVEAFSRRVEGQEQRLARLEESMGRMQRDLRQQILEQAKSFLDELHQVRGELAAAIDQEAAEPDGHGYHDELSPAGP